MRRATGASRANEFQYSHSSETAQSETAAAFDLFERALLWRFVDRMALWNGVVERILLRCGLRCLLLEGRQLVGRLLFQFLEVSWQPPDGEIAVRITAASVKGSAFAAALLDDFAFIRFAALRTEEAHALKIALGMLAIGVIGTTDEFAVAGVLYDEVAFFASWANSPHFFDYVLSWHFLPSGIQALGEGMVKLVKHWAPVHLAFGDVIQLVFHICGEVVVHLDIKVLGKQVANDATGLGGEEPSFLLDDVIASLDYADGGRIGAGSADSLLFQLLDERRFGVSRWRLREVLFGKKLPQIKCFAGFKIGKVIILAKS